MTRAMPKVFLSHTASDKLFVARLAVDLRRIGVGVWYDTWEIRGGESIVEKINEGLSANDHLIDAQGEEVGEITDSLFPKTFSNYPDCIMSETLKDVAIIVGSTLREGRRIDTLRRHHG